jgi:hypothetical protein
MFKKILGIFLASTLAATLVACGGGNDENHATDGPPSSGVMQHTPGNIPGMGETAGDLQGDVFTLPDGVVLNGTIQGALAPYEFATSSPKGLVARVNTDDLQRQRVTLSVVGNPDVQVGSGNDVTVLIPLRNTNAVATTVVFPARLVVRSNSTSYQSGILLKKTSVTVPANSNYVVALVMYCVNLHRAGSVSPTPYDFGVISNSSLIIDLTDRLANKKINVEEYGETANDYASYNAIYRRLADIVWNLTDRGIALSEGDRQWISALPNSQ